MLAVLPTGGPGGSARPWPPPSARECGASSPRALGLSVPLGWPGSTHPPSPMPLSIRFERLSRDAFTVTDRARPARVLVVYRDRDPLAYDALRELELCMADVTPRRERHLIGVIAAAWQARDARLGRPSLPVRPAA